VVIMQITTKFNVGDSVVFLHHDAFCRREISKISIEVNIHSPLRSPTIIYFFKDMVRDKYNSEVYKYETEIALSKAALAELMNES
jgi:hypothetical protein